MPDQTVLTSVVLTTMERRRCARALEFIACILGSTGDLGVKEHMELAERIMPEGEVLDFARKLMPR